MLFHHDGRDYEVAASEAADRARVMMQERIDKGRVNTMEVINQVMNQQPKDALVRAAALDFAPDDNGIFLHVPDSDLGDGGNLSVHRHALGQLAERRKIPMAYVNRLLDSGDWGRALLAQNLNEQYGNHEPDKRYLARTMDGELRGFLSDHYRRLDSRPIVQAFAGACEDVGAVPCEGYALDTKIAIKAMLPMVFEPVPNEVMCFGVVLENSDYGNGALSMRMFMLRLWCTNYGITDEALRQVHLGRRLDEATVYSNETYELDTKATASAIKDHVAGLLEPGTVEKACALVVRAHEDKIDAVSVTAFLKKNLGKGQADKVLEAFNSADVEMMPPGNTKWRLSNAISWVGGQTEDREVGLELMKLAGKVVAEA